MMNSLSRNLNNWPEPIAENDQSTEQNFGGRQLMAVPEELDEFAMEFDSDDKEKIMPDNDEEQHSGLKCSSDANMSSKDSEDQQDSDSKDPSGESWNDDEERIDNFGDHLDADNQPGSITLEENPIQVFKKPLDLAPAYEVKPQPEQCTRERGVKSFLQQVYKVEDIREDYIQRQVK